MQLKMTAPVFRLSMAVWKSGLITMINLLILKIQRVQYLDVQKNWLIIMIQVQPKMMALVLKLDVQKIGLITLINMLHKVMAHASD